jgi:hypothetical protein
MNREISRIIKEPEFQRWLIETQGITPPEDTSIATFRQIHERDIGLWAEVVKRSGATVD